MESSTFETGLSLEEIQSLSILQGRYKFVFLKPRNFDIFPDNHKKIKYKIDMYKNTKKKFGSREFSRELYCDY